MAKNATLVVYELLLAVNKKAVNGVLYNGDATLQAQAADLFNSLNKAGAIGDSPPGIATRLRLNVYSGLLNGPVWQRPRSAASVVRTSRCRRAIGRRQASGFARRIPPATATPVMPILRRQVTGWFSF